MLCTHRRGRETDNIDCGCRHQKYITNTRYAHAARGNRPLRLLMLPQDIRISYSVGIRRTKKIHIVGRQCRPKTLEQNNRPHLQASSTPDALIKHINKVLNLYPRILKQPPRLPAASKVKIHTDSPLLTLAMRFAPYLPTALLLWPLLVFARPLPPCLGK